MKMTTRKISMYRVYLHAITFTGLIIIAVSASKSDIMKTSKESWFTTEFIAKIVNVSFEIPSCCNIFIDAGPELVEKFLKGFAEIYPSEYTVNRPTYGCSRYLLMSSSVERLRYVTNRSPTNIASIDLLVVVFNYLEESAGLLDTSIFRNANANIVSINGLWTLSENYLWPRVFKRVSSPDKMKHERRVVNFHGQEIRAAAKFKPPYSYIQTTVNRTVDGVEKEYYVAKNESELDGIDMKIFMLIAEHLNFTWTIRSLPNKRDWYGMSNGTHWNGGVIEEIGRNELDIAFTRIWVSADKYRFVNLTQAWAMIHVHFLVPRPKVFSSFWALARPLSSDLWAAIITMLIIQSVYVYISAWVNPRIPRRFRNFIITWTEMLGRLLGTFTPKRMDGLQLQLQLWLLTGSLLVTAYSSSLAAILSRLYYEPTIDTPQDFIEANLTWGTEGKYHQVSYAADFTDPYGRQFEQRYEHHADQKERDRLILQGNYAILGNTIFSIFFPEEQVKNEYLSNFRLMKYSPAEFYVAFAVQPWLLEPIDKVMLRMREGGLAQHKVDTVLRENTGSLLREVLLDLRETDDDPVALQLFPLGGGFVLFGVGIFISIVMLYFELRSAATKKSILQELLKIKRNREVWQANQQKKRRMHSIRALKKIIVVQAIIKPKL